MPESGSKTSTVPVVWANLEFFRRDPNDFLSRLVTMEEAWLYYYDPETKQRSMEWRRSGSSSSLIIFQRAKLSTRSITYLCWYNWRTFEEKTPREFLLLARYCPGSPGTCNPEENGLPGLPVSWSPALFSGSGPVGLPPVPWTEKTIERSPFFVRQGGHCCRGDLVGRTTLIFFLSGLQKLEQRAKKCINPLALELDIYSLEHHLCKMWIFYEPRRITLGNTRHFVEEWTKMVTESLKK